jgi:hypothetical protein
LRLFAKEVMPALTRTERAAEAKAEEAARKEAAQRAAAAANT